MGSLFFSVTDVHPRAVQKTRDDLHSFVRFGGLKQKLGADELTHSVRHCTLQSLGKVAVRDAAVLDGGRIHGEAVAQRVEAAERVVDVQVRALQVAHAVRVGRELVATVQDSVSEEDAAKHTRREISSEFFYRSSFM